MKLEGAPHGRVRAVERQHAPVREPDLDCVAAALLHHDGAWPMHIVERGPRRLQRLLPGRRRLRRIRVGLDALDRGAEIGLRAVELSAPGGQLVAGEALLQRGLRRPLHLRVNGRANGGRACRERHHARQRFRLAIDVVEEIEAGIALSAIIGDEPQRRLARLIGGLLRDRAIFLHPAQDIGEALLRALGMAVRAVVIRPLGQPGERRALGEGQFRCGLSVIAARGKLDSPRVPPEIDGVEIKLENLVLAERLLDPRGEDHLADFALVSQVISDQEVLDHLLGDGRSALRAAGAGEIGDHGANEPALVNALVLVEALVFGRHERLLHMLRYVLEGNPDPPILRLEHFGETPAGRVEHGARAGQLEPLEPRMVGQVGGGLVVVGDDLADIDGRRLDRLVLAELPVDEMQAAEIQSAKRFDFGR